MRNALALIAVGCMLAGCATAPSNAVFNRTAGGEGDYTFQKWIDARPQLEPDMIVLSFSGGGLRAAALAASVLDRLARYRLDKNVAIISSTSGGSVTAGYFAAKGTAGMEVFDRKFLRNNNTADLSFRLLPSFLSGANRSVQFADYLDERLFDGAAVQYKDLMPRWGESPFVILNASDASSGKTFEFTQESFSTLCSDLGPFRLSEAIAASAAFPFLMTPIPLKNHWNEAGCPESLFDGQKYSKAIENRYLRLDEFVGWRHAHALRHTYSDPDTKDAGKAPHKRIEYVHLIDGGLSDNLAARALIRAFGDKTVEKLQEKGVKRILLIQVNAKTEELRPMDGSGALPSWLEVFKTVALNPIDVATELSSFISAEYWVSLIRYANASPEAVKQGEKVLRFYPVQVDFDQMEVNNGDDWKDKRKVQWALKQVPTNWTLSPDQVEQVKEAGSSLLESHPCFATFLWERGYREKQARPTGCDLVDVGPKRLVEVGPPSRPAAVAAAPAPKPAAKKLTLAVDALFDFDSALLSPEGKAKLDRLHADIKRITLEVIIVVGHADRIGSAAYNQNLSERRAAAVKDYLVSKGIDASRIYAEGKGERQPVTGDKCGTSEQKTRQLIECLRPDRRVEIEVVASGP